MNHSLLNQGARIQLINQLVYFDEEKVDFLNRYFPEYNHKRQVVEESLYTYCSTLAAIVHDLTEERLRTVALIGSKLTVRYLDDDSLETYTIVFPDQADPHSGYVSFLSPVGFQLLMAKLDGLYKLDIPSGETFVRVESITFVNYT